VKIPDSFQLGAHTVKVQKDARLKDAYGQWHDHKKLIQLRKPSADWGEHFALMVFFHELTHAMLEHMGRGDLSEQENFVDGLSECLTQFHMTQQHTEK
jgi:biotin carboxylase